MTTGGRPPDDLPTPLWVARSVVEALLPEPYREAFLGDLIEEYEAEVRPQLGPRRAGWWLWRQVLGSVVPMIRLRLAKGVPMTKWNGLAAAVIAGLGLLQARDSHTFRASPLVIGLVLVGIALPTVAALLSRSWPVHAASALACGVLLVVARLISATPLPELLLVAFIAFMSLFLLNLNRTLNRPDSKPGPVA
jgi:hypothetical protein